MKTTPNKLNIQPKEAELLTKEQLEFNLLLDRMNKAEAKIQIERQFLDTLLDPNVKAQVSSSFIMIAGYCMVHI